jgi:hypothetical protein
MIDAVAHPSYVSSPDAKELTKLELLTSEQNSLLYSITSVFPLDFFPTQLSIEKTKVNVIRNIFFASRQIQSMLIAEIASVEVDTTLFFATISIHNRLPGSNPFVIKNLKRDEAMRARRIIQGLVVGISAQIEWSKIPTEELIKKVEELGTAKVAA